MTETIAAIANKPIWVDLSSSDPTAARAFYATVFGWDIEVNPDPQYGGYALARIGGHDVAGIGGTQAAGQPSAWMLYIATDDVDALGGRVAAAGGTLVMPAFDVGDQGRMAIFQDPSGAFLGAWQVTAMSGFGAHGGNAYGWAEVNARGLAKVLPFYRDVFGWTAKASGDGDNPYTEFQVDGESVAGALDMQPMVPAEVPSYWQVYFNVDDLDATYARAMAAGGREFVAPQAFFGGRFAILADPQGAMFGLLAMGS